ncbi:MAG: hypothetical protein V4628_08010 [Pseudomonadota bacterium]
MRQECARFSAKNNAGTVFNVIAYQNYVVHKPLYGNPMVLESGVEFWTDTGLQLAQIDGEKFRIAMTKEVIRRLE